MRNFLILSFTIILAVLLVGCAKYPQEAIDAAQAALTAAKQAEADRYVPDLFNAAQKTLNDALALADKEKEAMFSNYDEALKLVTSATDAANNAANAVAAKKAEVKAATEAFLAQIPDAVKNAKKAWTKAPRGKGTREALAAIKADIEGQEKAVEEVNAALTGGDFLTAQQKAQAILDKLASLVTELQPKK
jgi:PBP1b-binding outer membrane lipoprotein LpoB